MCTGTHTDVLTCVEGRGEPSYCSLGTVYLFFETGSPTGPELIEEARQPGQHAPGVCHLPVPAAQRTHTPIPTL